MTTRRGWLLGVAGASTLLAAAATLHSPELAAPTPVPYPAPSPAAPAMPLASAAPRCDDTPERMPPASVAGTVVDETGAPVGGVGVAMLGNAAAVVSAADGSFSHQAVAPGRCRVSSADGWLAVESPLLDLCSPVDSPTLVVVRAAQLAGRVVDEHALPLAAARVAVELRVDLSTSRPAQSLRLTDAWSTTTDGDGWYTLRSAPVGPNATLAIELDGFAAARFTLGDGNVYRHVTLGRAAPMLAADDGSGAPQDAVGHRLEGGLADTHGQPLAGWWAAAVARDCADETAGPWGRFAGPPVQVGRDGHVSFDGLPAGRYRVEAWHPRNTAVARSRVVAVPANGATLGACAVVLPERVRGRVVDADGRPVAMANVGLGRPSAWAVPGQLAMHRASIVTTDRDGGFELATSGLEALELRVDGAGIVPMRTTLDAERADRPIAIRAAARRWLGHASGGSTVAVPPETGPDRSLDASLVALDAGGRALPMWTNGPASRPACDAAAGGPFGFPAVAHCLVRRVGSREVERLQLRR